MRIHAKNEKLYNTSMAVGQKSKQNKKHCEAKGEKPTYPHR
jgi:hypothetical protein